MHYLNSFLYLLINTFQYLGICTIFLRILTQNGCIPFEFWPNIGLSETALSGIRGHLDWWIGGFNMFNRPEYGFAGFGLWTDKFWKAWNMGASLSVLAKSRCPSVVIAGQTMVWAIFHLLPINLKFQRAILSKFNISISVVNGPFFCWMGLWPHPSYNTGAPPHFIQKHPPHHSKLMIFEWFLMSSILTYIHVHSTLHSRYRNNSDKHSLDFSLNFTL